MEGGGEAERRCRAFSSGILRMLHNRSYHNQMETNNGHRKEHFSG